MTSSCGERQARLRRTGSSRLLLAAGPGGTTVAARSSSSRNSAPGSWNPGGCRRSTWRSSQADRPAESCPSVRRRYQMEAAAIPTKARKCSALRLYRRWSRLGSRPARTRFSRPPSDVGPTAVRTRCLCVRCGGGFPARGAIAAGGRSRIPCRRAVSPAVGVGDREGSEWAGCPAQVERALAVVHVRIGDAQGQRQSVLVGDQVDLRSQLAARSDAVRSVAPFCGPHADRVDRAPRPVQLTSKHRVRRGDPVDSGPGGRAPPPCRRGHSRRRTRPHCA